MAMTAEQSSPPAAVVSAAASPSRCSAAARPPRAERAPVPRRPRAAAACVPPPSPPLPPPPSRTSQAEVPVGVAAPYVMECGHGYNKSPTSAGIHPGVRCPLPRGACRRSNIVAVPTRTGGPESGGVRCVCAAGLRRVTLASRKSLHPAPTPVHQAAHTRTQRKKSFENFLEGFYRFHPWST